MAFFDVWGEPLVQSVSFPIKGLWYYRGGEKATFVAGTKIRISTTTAKLVIDEPPSDEKRLPLIPHGVLESGAVQPLQTVYAPVGVHLTDHVIWNRDYIVFFMQRLAEHFGVNIDEGDWSREDEEVVYAIL